VLMLPLKIDNPSLFGDDLQFVPCCVTFLLESAGVAVGVARARGMGTARRPRGSLAMAGVVAGAGAGFHQMSLRAQRKSSERR
jgi:hypothetical protein